MKKAEKTRAYIVEKTAPIFNKKGFAGTSLSDMTEATGLTKGSIYGNFSCKDEVALAAFDHNLGKMQAIIAAQLSKHTSIKEKLIAYADVYASFFKGDCPAGGCPVLNTAIEADDTHPKLRQKAIDAVSAWTKSIAGMIEEGIAHNELRADVDAEQIAIAVIALIEGGIMLYKLTGKANYRNAIMESIDQMIKGLIK